VDGFRLDNVKQIIPELPKFSNTKSTHDWLKQFRLFYKGIRPDSMTFGEVWESNPNILQAYVQGDEIDLVTAFDFVWSVAPAVNSGNNGNVIRALGEDIRLMPDQQFLTFINNHDTDRVMSDSPSFQGGVGVGVGENPQKAKVAASLYLTAPGVPILYNGEEIGMRGIKLNAQGGWVSDNSRRVMQWSSDRIAAGFSTIYPTNREIYTDEWNFIDIYNVGRETNDPNSILSHYRTLIALRNAHPALRVGSLNIITTGNPELFASLRISSAEALLVLVNLTDKPITNYMLSLGGSQLGSGPRLSSPLMGEGPFSELNVNAQGGFHNYKPTKEIPIYATLIIQLSPK
jgi:alpha-amylase